MNMGIGVIYLRVLISGKKKNIINCREHIKRGLKQENIRHYGFAFKGKEVLIGALD